MKAVFEELNGEMAVFVVEGPQEIFHLEASLLPEDARVGDVYEVRVDGARLVLVEKLEDERHAREVSAQSKREELLRRNKKE